MDTWVGHKGSKGVAPTELAVSFGRVLRSHRHSAGLTQEELAERAGVSPRSISDLERGAAHVPRRDTVALLVRALRLNGPEREEFQALVERQRQTAVRPTQGAPHAARTGWRTSAVPPPRSHNLPRSLDTFVGHDRDLHQLGALLPATPLITLVGGGGVGKTRLAHELAWRQLCNQPETWLVELASLDDPEQLVATIAACVGAPRSRAGIRALADYLQARPLLLLLDNCEHLVEACAEVVAHLLRHCPHLRVLATSREPLGIAGEVIWSVLPLECPDTVEQIDGASAARLFVDRARAVSPLLQVTDATARAIARICHTVEGSPLALELAASRTRTLAIIELAERLEHDARILSRRLHLERRQHQAIGAGMESSDAQLSRQERIVLEHVTRLDDSWTLEAAEHICAQSGLPRHQVLDLLGQLVDKSLVIADTSGARAWYRVSSPVWRYARAGVPSPRLRSRKSET
jgi:non-specific serine/threonine protein kinase